MKLFRLNSTSLSGRLMAAAALALFASGVALADTEQANMDISATVTDNCTISAAALSFGDYNAIGSSNTDGSADLTVTCTNESTATIRVGQGQNPGGSSTEAAPVRRLIAGANEFLSYQLYTTSGRSTVWNNTTGVGYTGTGSATSVTVFGRIPTGQNTAVAGSYADQVVVSIDF
jgi:spore coat protein U-like protein